MIKMYFYVFHKVCYYNNYLVVFVETSSLGYYHKTISPAVTLLQRSTKALWHHILKLGLSYFFIFIYFYAIYKNIKCHNACYSYYKKGVGIKKKYTPQ